MEGSGKRSKWLGARHGGGRPPKLGGGSARNPLLPYTYVWGNGDTYVIIARSRLCREESLKSCRVPLSDPLPLPPFPVYPSQNKDETQLRVTFFQLMRVCASCDYVRASFFQRFTHGGLALQHILHNKLRVTQLWKDSSSCLVTACGL